MTAARSTRYIRARATDMLRAHGIYSAPVPIDEIARRLGAEIHYVPYEGELAGMLIRQHGRTIIGVNNAHHRNRKRFTIAHELGHLVLHDLEIHIDHNFKVRRDSKSSVALIHKRDGVSSLAIDPLEIEANRFAAEILMPFDMIRMDLESANFDYENIEEVKPLARRYVVSPQAMLHRIANIGHM